MLTQITINNQELWEEMLCFKGLMGKDLANVPDLLIFNFKFRASKLLNLYGVYWGVWKLSSRWQRWLEWIRSSHLLGQRRVVS